MAKVGRNQPCTCGSGNKYKRCCGAIPLSANGHLPPSVWAGIDQKCREMEALQKRRIQQQGLGRPIVSTDMDGLRVVAVGKRFYHSSKWRTFHDFLRDYLLGSLGPDWVNAEQAKPLGERHQILRWYAQAVETAKALQVADGTIISGPMTGAIRAFMNLAYNIYLIAHHGDGQAMADIYLKRLRSARADDFIGALFETYAAASFLKAGFGLTYEETERRSSTCVEFVATWPKTGEHFSVEVKSRHHTADPALPDGGVDEIKRLRVGSKLVKALAKAADHTRVVMIEINIPDKLTERNTLDGWPAAALEQIRSNEIAKQKDGSPFPPAYVFVTNHPFHHDLTGTSGSMQALATGFHIPDFGPDVRYRGYTGVMAARERHSAMTALIESMRTHYEIPATFDGELPSSLVAMPELPRLQFGRRYLIPDGIGNEQAGRFYSASVNTTTGLVHGAYELADGRHVIATNTLSPDELAEYVRYPETYFGEVVKPGGKVETFVEMCDFLFDCYQHSTREQLLEFMANATDIEHLKTLGQRDLAIAYCERMASVVHAREGSPPTSKE